MARNSLAIAAALALAVLPAMPTTAQSADGSLEPVYFDLFDSDEPTWTATAAAGSAEGNSWFQVEDTVNEETRLGWYASRPNATGGPGGYDNSVDVRLTSPGLAMPFDYLPRSVAVVIRGSSENGADVLHLEWAPAPNSPDEQWKPLGSWTGGDLAESYRLEEAYSVAFQSNRDSFAVRLRFSSNDVCDSDPGSPGPDPGESNVDPGVEVDPEGNPPVTGEPTAEPGEPSEGEILDLAGCCGDLTDPVAAAAITECGAFGAALGDEVDPAFLGWHVDSVFVIGRRDFTAAVAPTAPRLPFRANGAGATVDLFVDRGKLIDFRLDPSTVPVPSGVESMLVHLDRKGSDDTFNLAAAKGADGIWSALLAIDEPELVAGEWDVRYFGTQAGGSSLLASKVLTVKVTDQTVPRLAVSPVGDPVRMGPGQALAVSVQEAFLRRVNYTYPGLPAPIQLRFPYVVPNEAFPEGPTKVTFRAEDRAGHTAALDVNIERDTVRPALSILGPATVYSGVPFDLTLAIVERSAHTIEVDVGGTVIHLSGKANDAAAGNTTTLKVTPPEAGNLTITAKVVDALGNEALRVRQFIAVLPVTDLRVNEVRLVSPATNTSAEGQSIVAVVEQVGGVAPLPVTVTFEAAGRSQAYTVTVPASGPFEVRWDAKLPPGLQTVKVHAAGPAAANETLPGNENGTMTVESFLGRVTVGSKVYNVRADSRGLPATAVQAGTGKTYPLALVQSGGGVSYQFTADGNRTVVWDPLEPVMELEAATSSPTSGGKDAPFPGLLMALAVLALAALGQRRRQR